MASFFDSSTSFSSDPCPYCPEIVNLVNHDLKIKKKKYNCSVHTKSCIGNNFKKVHEWKIYPLKKNW